MEPRNKTVNGEVAIDFSGDGSYAQRPPHSPTFGHAQWSSFTIDNQTPQREHVSNHSQFIVPKLFWQILKNKHHHLKIQFKSLLLHGQG